MNPNEQPDLKLQDVVEVEGIRYLVSTIKMEVRHAWLNQNSYVKVYETIVFEKENGQVQYDKVICNKRYTTYKCAVDGHAATIKNLPNIIKACNAARESM
ncbi:hypothetical protein [Sulfurospirillum sp. 1612]|uniref:hypothetical protein n=1 Tax=Sulfurospirillum sp. 1612 TaxID=3094835 RepID=UPI002F95E3B9